MESRKLTNLLLAVIAMALLGLLFRGERGVIPEARAQSPIDRGFPYQLVMGCYSSPQNPCVPTALRVDVNGYVYTRQ